MAGEAPAERGDGREREVDPLLRQLGGFVARLRSQLEELLHVGNVRREELLHGRCVQRGSSDQRKADLTALELVVKTEELLPALMDDQLQEPGVRGERREHSTLGELREGGCLCLERNGGVGLVAEVDESKDQLVRNILREVLLDPELADRGDVRIDTNTSRKKDIYDLCRDHHIQIDENMTETVIDLGMR